MSTELATAYISLVPSASGIKGNITRELGGAGSAAAKQTEKAFQGTASRTGKAFKTMFRSAAIGGAALFVGGAAALKSTVEAASNLDEAESKVAAIFGAEGQAKVDQWAAKAAQAFGQSKTQATDAIGTYGNLLTSFGVGKEDALGMSTTLTGLASDLASFNNTSVDEAIQALRSGLSGETEPLKRYGVALDDASLKAKALALGISDGKSQLTPAQKAQATYALVLERTKNAQGDFARTSTGLANQQRIFAARWENLKVTIGKGLLPVINKLMPVVGKLFDAIGPFAEKMGPKMNDVFQKMGAWWQTNGPQVMATAQKVFGQIKKYAETLIVVVSGVVDVVQTLWRNFGNNIMEFARRAWGPVQQYIGGVMKAIQGIIHTITALIHGDWSGVWNGIKEIVSGVWSAIQGIVKFALEELRFIVGVGLEILGSVFKSMWEGIKNAASAALEWVVGKFLTFVDWVKRLPGALVDLFAGMFDGIKGAFRSALNWVIDKWNAFKLPKQHIPGTNIDIGGYGLPHIDPIPKFHQGGIVPGSPGTEVPIMALAGERVLSPSQTAEHDRGRRRGRGGNVTVIAKGATARAVGDELMWGVAR